MSQHLITRPILLALAALVIPACSQGSDPPAPMVPDFHLADANPNSATFNQTVSPRGFEGMVPGFYFTHAN